MTGGISSPIQMSLLADWFSKPENSRNSTAGRQSATVVPLGQPYSQQTASELRPIATSLKTWQPLPKRTIGRKPT
jgi:hypothetical protein